jgi:hypothetical protein
MRPSWGKYIKVWGMFIFLFVCYVKSNETLKKARERRSENSYDSNERK